MQSVNSKYPIPQSELKSEEDNPSAKEELHRRREEPRSTGSDDGVAGRVAGARRGREDDAAGGEGNGSEEPDRFGRLRISSVISSATMGGAYQGNESRRGDH